MNYASLQALTWGTVSAAVASAVLLAAARDEASIWRFGPPTVGVRADAPTARGNALPSKEASKPGPSPQRPAPSPSREPARP